MLHIVCSNSYVENHDEMHIKGPFYGLLGYSQGSAFIPIYLGKLYAR